MEIPYQNLTFDLFQIILYGCSSFVGFKKENDNVTIILPLLWGAG